MKLDLVGKGIKVSDDIRSFVDHKLASFERRVNEIGEGEVDVVITFNVEKTGNRNRVDIDVYLKTRGGGALHAWEESEDIYKSLEFAADDVSRQLDRLKERRLETRKEIQREKEKSRLDVALPTLMEREQIIEETLPIRKPMSVEDASIILINEGRFFFPFRNAENDEINVIYRKTNGSYGLILP